MAASQPAASPPLAQRSLRCLGGPWGIPPRPGAPGHLCENRSGPCLLPRGSALSRQPQPRTCRGHRRHLRYPLPTPPREVRPRAAAALTVCAWLCRGSEGGGTRGSLSQPRWQTVGRWEQPQLVSAGWKHRKACGDYFQLEPSQAAAPALQAPPPDAGQGPSFQEMGLQPALIAGLEGLSISRPTAVQRITIPALRRGRSALCAAETGSGKTLAYLLPLLDGLLSRPAEPEVEAAGPAAPRGLVVLPSRELALQVCAVAAALCRPAGLHVRGLTGGGAAGGLRRQLRAPPPGPAVLLGTPGALQEALRRRFLALERLRWMVLDEADTLMDDSFAGILEEILAHAPLAVERTQVVVVGATFPTGLSQTLGKFTDVGQFVTLATQSLHRLPPHVQQKFVRIKGQDKLSELLQLLKEHPVSSGAVIIFCKSASTVNWLGYILDDHKIKHLRLQGQMSAAARANIFASFQKGDVSILVCTDLASRGLDTSSVQLVVNYDFPDTLQDYLHRVGRVGRPGKGRVSQAWTPLLISLHLARVDSDCQAVIHGLSVKSLRQSKRASVCKLDWKNRGLSSRTR
uniref:RNA helicase n=1 Tax=Melopsittacus undulatus TaxID=13146 RepID=A0A8V5GPD8_MELUD